MMQIYLTGQQNNTNNKNKNGNTENNCGKSKEKPNHQVASSQKEYQILMGSDESFPSTSQQTSSSHYASLKVGRESFDQSYVSDDDRFISTCTPSHPNLNLLLYIITYIVFMIFGACLFTLMEQPVEFQIRDQLMRKQQAFLAKHECIDADSLNSFMEFVITAQENGVDLREMNHLMNQMFNRKSGAVAVENVNRFFKKEGQPEMNLNDRIEKIEAKSVKMIPPLSSHFKPKTTQTTPDVVQKQQTPTQLSSWDFTSSLLFVTSLVTTIGYGHVTPLTQAGKIACILFATIGIPATLTFLSTMVALLLRGPAAKLETLLFNLISRFFRTSQFLVRIIHLVLITFTLVSLCFLIPATIFSYLESNWSFLDAFYYCYISLTTIGLGDFVPASFSSTSANITLYRIGTIFYLYIGLTMVMLWLALIYRIPQFNLNKLLLSEKYKIEIDNNERKQIIGSQETLPTKTPNINYGTSFK